MSEQELSKGIASISVKEANELVQFFAKATTKQNPEHFAAGFTEDCVIRFNCEPEIHGTQAVIDFFTPIFSQKRVNFLCSKNLRSISGHTLGVEWHSTWADESGKQYEIRGHEFWVMRGNKIARWDAVATAANELP